MKNMAMTELVKMVQQLSDKDQAELVDKIMSMLQTSGTKDQEVCKNASCHKMVCEIHGERPDCPYCHAKANLGYVVKRGFKNGVQRFYCKDCGRRFVATTNTVFARSRKDADTWRKFIKMTISGSSLADCTYECEIAYQTAFTWRHKILNAFKVNQSSTMLSGKVEIDEMLIPISYKGNHHKGLFHTKGYKYGPCTDALPRKPFLRGSDNRSLSSKDKACVFCMVEGDAKAYYAAVPGLGFMQPNMLDRTVAKHISRENTLVLADRYRITQNYLRDNQYQYMVLASDTSKYGNKHKVEVIDGNHLQHVNSMHHHIRVFLAKYCGVATKYLENYISLFVWVKNAVANKQKNRLQKVSLSRTSIADCYITRRSIESMPSVPSVA